MENPKFQLFKDSASEFRFRLRAKNGEIILRSSEGYASKQGCQKGIGSVKENAPIDSRYGRHTATNGKYYFILKAGNGEPLGISEMYNSTAGRENGIAAVKRDAPGAPTEDLT
ncbi:YegP family protein [Lewinella sp. LCG006]|uniref:YegP family protein n=1 Tax=Lewinella sp. LCG006 TaxID=3231911 RepID=UPI00345FA7C8